MAASRQHHVQWGASRCLHWGGGGPLEKNGLSSYFVQVFGDRTGVICDVGTLLLGLKAIATSPTHPPLLDEVYFLRNNVSALCVSHAHLDHVSGMVVDSTALAGAPITVYGWKETIETLVDNVFNWRVWPNFGDRGNPPLLRQYSYRELSPASWIPINGTSMTMQAFPLSHSSINSTVFLFRSPIGRLLLYLGDTGPDQVEHTERLSALWQAVATEARGDIHKVDAILIECSYMDPRSAPTLFGHLSPQWLILELQKVIVSNLY
jgi:3',5'-cyclic-nucleotide phosphodiesterase